jgi:hypothetical protein
MVRRALLKMNVPIRELHHRFIENHSTAGVLAPEGLPSWTACIFEPFGAGTCPSMVAPSPPALRGKPPTGI